MASLVLGEEPPKYKPIDGATIAAYEALGAKHGYLSIELGLLRFTQAKETPVERLPSFWLDDHNDADKTIYPAVEVPPLALSSPEA
jgi:hypothetical protein